MSVINTEIHQDIVEAASTLKGESATFNMPSLVLMTKNLKETYWFLLNSVDLQTEMEEYNDAHIQTVWRIPLTKLKRLDSMDRDWSMTSTPLLHHMPDILLEPILFIEDTITPTTSWDWQNLSSFPIIETNPMTVKDDYTEHSLKIQCEKRLLDKLVEWEQLTTTTETTQTNNAMIMDYATLLNSRVELRQQWHFVPTRDLNDFKRIQPCLKEKDSKTRICELDNLRFRF